MQVLDTDDCVLDLCRLLNDDVDVICGKAVVVDAKEVCCNKTSSISELCRSMCSFSSLVEANS